MKSESPVQSRHHSISPSLSPFERRWALWVLVGGGRTLFKVQWQATPVLLPGKSHGRRSLVGCSPWGCYESDPTEWLHFRFSLSHIGEGNGSPLQCFCLENPRDGGAGGLPSMGSHRVRHDWSDLAEAAAVLSQDLVQMLCLILSPPKAFHISTTYTCAPIEYTLEKGNVFFFPQMNSLGLLSGYFLFGGIVIRSKMFLKTSVIAKMFVYLFQVLIMLGFFYSF